ncbi:MAG: kelch repeat-containing protein [Myxococcota bacterium]
MKRFVPFACALWAWAILASCERAGPVTEAISPAEPAPVTALRAAAAPFAPVHDGFEARIAPTGASTIRAHAVRLPPRADQPVVFTFDDGTEVSVVRPGAAPAVAEGERRDVRYPGLYPGVDSLWLRLPNKVEELLFLREPRPVVYDIGVPPGARLVAGAGPTARVERDGQALLHVLALEAWDARGETVSVQMTVAEHRIRIEAEAEHYPIVIDPAWIAASTPLQLRADHTANLLGDGTAVLIGGDNGAVVLASIERFDPQRGTSRLAGDLTTARSRHTATVLGDGRVLVVGGTDANGGALAAVEIYDPATDTATAGPDLAAARSGHAAVRLLDGRVLVVGGGSSSGTLFDPATDTWSADLPMAGVTFSDTAAARLTSGEVLVTGQFGNDPTGVIFDPTTDTFTLAPNPLGAIELLDHNLVPLPDGRAVMAGGGFCSSTGGSIDCVQTAQVFDPAGGGSWTLVPDTSFDRIGAGAAQLPSGAALFVGAFDAVTSDETITGETFDPATDTFSLLPGNLSAEHQRPTALVLPTGDTMVVGGTQAAAQLLVGEDVPVGLGLMQQARAAHASVLLADGRVLLAGGVVNNSRNTTATAELYDQGTSMATSSLPAGRAGAASVLLDDGRVLIAGGFTNTSETAIATAVLFDPATETFDATANELSVGRKFAGIERLRDGRVLIVGGQTGSFNGAGLDSADIFDPATDSFAPATNTLDEAVRQPAVQLVDDGRVIVAGVSQAFVFDPDTTSFAPLGPLGASYETARFQRLADGRVLLTGGATLQAELYDPATATFSFTGAESIVRTRHAVAPLPGGNALVVGGVGPGVSFPPIWDLFSVFAPAGAPTGVFVDTTYFSTLDPRATLLPSGRVLVSGGLPCDDGSPGICAAQAVALEVPPPPATAVSFPTVTQAPSAVTPGTEVEVTGTDFDGPQLSSAAGATSSGRPVVTWQPMGRNHVLFGNVVRFGPTTVTFTLPATVYAGSGWLRVIVNGRSSRGVVLTLDPPPNGVGCTFDADCASGFCTEGVCCDRRCDDNCEGCTAARKGSGEDGVCGAVPPERFVDDACFLSAGAPCADAAACDSGSCVDGVCCDQTCEGQCEACDVAGSVGVCVPTTGAPRGDRPACEAEPPADLCEASVCDGAVRDACAGTVGPCGVYACTAAGCLDRCEDEADCAVGHRCDPETNTCVVGVCEGSVATLPTGEQIDCAPFVCLADGSCRTTCADVNDCVAPFACNFEGRCVTRPPNDELDDGCGCRLGGTAAPGGSGGRWVALVGALAALVGRRRRRRRGAGRRKAGRRGAARRLGVVGMLAGAVVMGWLLGETVAHAQPTPKPTTAGAAKPAEAEAPAEENGAEDASREAKAEASPRGTVDEEAKAEARRRFRKGLALIRERSWAAALAEFLASRRLFPTRVATFNAAAAYRELGRYAEALETYEDLMRTYPDMADADLTEVRKAVTELRGRVGRIEIDRAEPGAQIVVDGTVRGVYPPPGDLRVSAGSHIVRLVKEGFEPFEARVDLAGGERTRVEAVMTALTESGQLKVVETTGAGEVEVLVDDVVVGTAPWAGRLSVGQHSVRLRGKGDLGTAPVAAPVRSQETTNLRLSLVALTASLRVEPTPATASVFVDSVEVGRGIWSGRLPAGTHRVEIRSEGFYPQTETVDLGDGQERLLEVALERSDEIRVPGRVTFDLVAAGLLTPSVGGDVAGRCDAGCRGGVGLGVMARLHVGYEFPFGLGLGAMGGFATASQSFDGRTTSVQPVGFDRRDGTASDALRIQGPFVGAFASWLFDGDFPLLVRLGGGPMFAQVRDQRTGTVILADGAEYSAGPIVQEPSEVYVALFPEVRGGIRLDEHFVVTAGLEIPVWVAVTRPSWDATRTVDAEVDGIGAWETESLTGRVVAFASLSVGARAEF